MHSKIIKFDRHGSKSQNDQTKLKFCTLVGLIQILLSPTSLVIGVTPGDLTRSRSGGHERQPHKSTAHMRQVVCQRRAHVDVPMETKICKALNKLARSTPESKLNSMVNLMPFFLLTQPLIDRRTLRLVSNKQGGWLESKLKHACLDCILLSEYGSYKHFHRQLFLGGIYYKWLTKGNNIFTSMVKGPPLNIPFIWQVAPSVIDNDHS